MSDCDAPDPIFLGQDDFLARRRQERESRVLLCVSLELLGDRYVIYGFWLIFPP